MARGSFPPSSSADVARDMRACCSINRFQCLSTSRPAGREACCERGMQCDTGAPVQEACMLLERVYDLGRQALE